MDALERWYENFTFEEAVGGLEDELRNIKKGYVAAGFYMKYIKNNKLYEEAGYRNIWEFAETKYGISKSTASRWMAINNKFSKDGNSPFLKEQFEQFEKSQLQEMLYLDDKQMEKVTPDMTTKEIREIRKPAVVEEVSILGHPLRVYPEGNLIASHGCGKQDCFSCHRDGCNLRQEDCWCVEATCGNPFSCTTLKVVDALREEIGSKCQFVNEDLAFHRAGDGQPVPCCKKCNNPCGYECRRSSDQRYKERLSKPDEKQEEYLKAAAKHLILRKFEWFKEKNYERVVNTTMIPMEIKAKCLPNNATWYFATEIGVGHINLFEKYVQLWDEKSNCIGNFEWFYFARAIQKMWPTVSVEKAREKFREEKENYSVNTESEAVATSQQKEQIPGQMEVYDYPELIPEDMQEPDVEHKEIPVHLTTTLTYLVEAVLEGYDIEGILKDVSETDTKEDILQDELFNETVFFEFCNKKMTGEFLSGVEIYERETGSLLGEYTWQQFFEEFGYITSVNEKTNQESITDELECDNPRTDIELLKKMLREDNKMLEDMLECCTEEEEMVRIQKLKITALASFLCELDEEEPLEQIKPEFPRLKNNDERKKFLENYQTWPIWFEVPEASEVYHRFDLPDGSSIAICEYHHYVEWKEKYGENPESIYCKEYLLKPGYKYLHDCGTNRTALIEHLKNVQKGEK